MWAVFTCYQLPLRLPLQRTGRVPIDSDSDARWPFAVSDCSRPWSLPTVCSLTADITSTPICQVTLHQGEIETILSEALAQEGVDVDRPVRPSTVTISSDDKDLQDPGKYPIKVS